MIFVECKPDYLLIITLETGIRRKEIIHEGGKNNVCNKLRRSNNSIALVDEDPLSQQHPYIQRMQEVKHDNNNGIRVKFDKSNNNYLIILCPRLEDWILTAARMARVDLNSCGLSDDPKELHKVINVNLKKLESLLHLLIGKSDRLIKLKNILRELESATSRS